MAAMSSAAQPAQQTGVPLWPDAELTDVPDGTFSRIYSFHAYNVGWNYTDKNRSEKWLADEIVRLYQENGFDAIGISEIFEVEYDDDAAKKKSVEERLLGVICTALPISSNELFNFAKCPWFLLTNY